MPSTPNGVSDVELNIASASSAVAGAGADQHGWDKDRTSRLIDLWRQRPALYDFTCETYRDRSGRRIAVAEIASLLHAEEHDVVKKMKNLRRQYSRERSMIEAAKAAGQHPTFVSSWYYYPKLTFLELFMNSKPGVPGAATRDAESLETVESDSGDGDCHYDSNRLGQPDACEWTVAAERALPVLTVAPDRNGYGRQAPASSNCLPNCFPVGPTVVELSSPQPPHLLDSRTDWAVGAYERSPRSDAADDDTMRSSESDGRRSAIGETRSGSQSTEGFRQPEAASPARSATGVVSFSEPPGGNPEQFAQSLASSGSIRRAPISELNHVRRFKRKRLTTVRTITPTVLSAGSRQRADADVPTSAGPCRPSSSPAAAAAAAAASWDCDDVFGRFVADELRQIADDRLKRITKFRLHALLLEAHGGTASDTASAATPAVIYKHSPYPLTR